MFFLKLILLFLPSPIPNTIYIYIVLYNYRLFCIIKLFINYNRYIFTITRDNLNENLYFEFFFRNYNINNCSLWRNYWTFIIWCSQNFHCFIISLRPREKLFRRFIHYHKIISLLLFDLWEISLTIIIINLNYWEFTKYCTYNIYSQSVYNVVTSSVYYMIKNNYFEYIFIFY